MGIFATSTRHALLVLLGVACATCSMWITRWQVDVSDSPAATTTCANLTEWVESCTMQEQVVVQFALLKNKTVWLQEYVLEVRVAKEPDETMMTFAMEGVLEARWEWTRDEIVVVRPDDAVVFVLDEQCRLVNDTCMLSMGPQCEACVPGYFRDNATKVCQACPENFFKQEYGSRTACSACSVPLTTLGLTGQSTCWGCADGVCSTCALGFELPACKACAPGTYGTDAHECVECAAGTFSTGHAVSTCTECARGTFASGNGSSICESCGAFSVAPERGAVRCECVRGSAWDHSGTRCVACLPGEYMPVDQCLPCPPGTHCKQAGCGAQCDECAYAPWAGATACSECVGQNLSQTICLCPHGFFSWEASSHITSMQQCQACTVQCPKASYMIAECTPWADTQCKACATECPVDGFYVVQECTHTTDIVCARCSTRCLKGSYMVQACTRNQNMVCAPCQVKCAQGHVLVRPCDTTHNLECSACPMGAFAANGTCYPCAEGFFAATAGSHECQKCDGMTNVQQTECYEQCPPGAYPLTYTACALCPPMTYGPTGHGCISCVGGNFNVWGATSC